jgi:hypothetical protein
VLAGAAAEENANAEFFLHVWLQVSTNFRVFCGRKNLGGAKVVFAGGFRVFGCLLMVNCGHFVVKSVANVVCCGTVLRVGKLRTFCRYFFEGEEGAEKSVVGRRGSLGG